MNISEIARRAGVSSAAVSRYFNHGYISEGKRAAIQKVVEETGYMPSAQARTLRTKKTRSIGVIVPRIDSEAISRMVAGILKRLDMDNYRLLLSDTLNDPEREREYLEIFSQSAQVDGLIFIATVFPKEHLELLSGIRIPLVILGQRCEGYTCVYQDDFHAAKDLTERMLSKGRKKLGMLSALFEDEASGRARYEGFSAALLGAGHPEDMENVVITDFSVGDGYDKMKQLHERVPDLDGVLCGTDPMAVGALSYLKEKGISVPDSVMLAGHGDTLVSSVITPSITSARFPYKESGFLAADLLLRKLDGEEGLPDETCMSYEIVEKDT